MNDTPETAANKQSFFSPSTKNSTLQKYKGIGGWLLLFCLILTVFSLIGTLFSIVTTYLEVSKYFAQFPRLLTVTVIDIFLSLSFMTYSIYAGIRLWRIRPRAVHTAKQYILFSLVYVLIASLLSFMAGFPSSVNETLVIGGAKSMFKGIIFVVTWYSYLNKSQRVRATYNDDENGKSV